MSKDEALNLALEALEHMCMHTRAKVGYRNKLIGEAMDKARSALAEQPAPPPECKTDAEKTAFAFGWWKALEENRKQPAPVAKPHEQQSTKCVEPVAWMVDVDLANYQGQSEYRTILAWNAKPVWSGTHEINEVLKSVPLYTAPPAERKLEDKPLAPRKPLTDEQIKLVMDGRGEEGDDDYVKPAFDPFGISEDDLINFARAIEAAHGIKGEA